MHLVSWLYSAIFGSAATSFDSTDESVRYHTYAGACWVLNSPAYLWFPASEVGRCPRIPRHSLFVVVGAGWFFHPFRQCLWPWLSFTLPCAHRNIPWRSVVPCITNRRRSHRSGTTDVQPFSLQFIQFCTNWNETKCYLLLWLVIRVMECALCIVTVYMVHKRVKGQQ